MADLSLQHELEAIEIQLEELNNLLLVMPDWSSDDAVAIQLTIEQFEERLTIIHQTQAELDRSPTSPLPSEEPSEEPDNNDELRIVDGRLVVVSKVVVPDQVNRPVIHTPIGTRILSPSALESQNSPNASITSESSDFRWQSVFDQIPDTMQPPSDSLPQLASNSQELAQTGHSIHNPLVIDDYSDTSSEGSIVHQDEDDNIEFVKGFEKAVTKIMEPDHPPNEAGEALASPNTISELNTNMYPQAKDSAFDPMANKKRKREDIEDTGFDDHYAAASPTISSFISTAATPQTATEDSQIDIFGKDAPSEQAIFDMATQSTFPMECQQNQENTPLFSSATPLTDIQRARTAAARKQGRFRSQGRQPAKIESKNQNKPAITTESATTITNDDEEFSDGPLFTSRNPMTQSRKTAPRKRAKHSKQISTTANVDIDVSDFDELEAGPLFSCSDPMTGSKKLALRKTSNAGQGRRTAIKEDADLAELRDGPLVSTSSPMTGVEQPALSEDIVNAGHPFTRELEILEIAVDNGSYDGLLSPSSTPMSKPMSRAPFQEAVSTKQATTSSALITDCVSEEKATNTTSDPPGVRASGIGPAEAAYRSNIGIVDEVAPLVPADEAQSTVSAPELQANEVHMKTGHEDDDDIFADGPLFTTANPLKENKVINKTTGYKKALNAKLKQRIECLVCLETFPGAEMTHLICNHSACNDCLKQMFLNAIKDESQMPPKCCSKEIPVKWAYTPGKKIISNSEFEKFYVKRKEVMTKDRVYCSNNRCLQFIAPQFISQGVAYCGTNKRRKGCHAKTCARCGQAEHTDMMLCTNKDESTLALEALARTERWRQCPDCKMLIEHSSGCYHMTCRCSAEWCYLCGKLYTNHGATCDCRYMDEFGLGVGLQTEPEGPPLRDDNTRFARAQGWPGAGHGRNDDLGEEWWHRLAVHQGVGIEREQEPVVPLPVMAAQLALLPTELDHPPAAGPAPMIGLPDSAFAGPIEQPTPTPRVRYDVPFHVAWETAQRHGQNP